VDPSGDAFATWLPESFSAGLAAIDTDGCVRVLNGAARRILGIPAGGEPLGRSCREVFREEPALADLLLAALEGNEAPGRAELELRGRGGLERAIGFTLAPVRDGSGALRGALLLFRDLQPLERLDERERLRERLVALGQMAAGLAHEIRNPLASLGVLAGLLRRRLGAGSEERALVDELRGELRDLEGTVNTALDFVKPAHLAPAPVPLVGALEAALAQVRARLPFDGEILRDFETPAPVVQGDAEQLRGVFANLVANAFEAMRGAAPRRLGLRVFRREASPDERVLRVPARGPLPGLGAGEAVVEVSDTGPGVPAELRERIFYPFFTTKERGSGVGLALAHKAVASHGGSLEVEGSEAGGALFRVRLPLGEAGR
jgi:two-component system, NtrC family, sensor histidine kinase AtoS